MEGSQTSGEVRSQPGEEGSQTVEDSQTVNHVGGILREGGDLVVFFHLCSKSAT